MGSVEAKGLLVYSRRFDLIAAKMTARHCRGQGLATKGQRTTHIDNHQTCGILTAPRSLQVSRSVCFAKGLCKAGLLPGNSVPMHTAHANISTPLLCFWVHCLGVPNMAASSSTGIKEHWPVPLWTGFQFGFMRSFLLLGIANISSGCPALFMVNVYDYLKFLVSS